MRIAVMQPYLFPYIGYFQLIRAADKFVFYDDVAFIKQGWINRNNILVNGKAHLFSVPVKNISSFETINQTMISYKADWTKKLLKSLYLAYKKSPFFEEVYPLAERVIASKPPTIGALAKDSVRTVCAHLGLERTFVDSSSLYGNSALIAETRIIDICKKENAQVYVNMIGGKELYSKAHFNAKGIELQFLKTNAPAYKQYGGEFVPYLSILDVLLFNGRERTAAMLDTYTIAEI